MFKKVYRIKKADSIYYIRWITEPDEVGIIYTDIKEEALCFQKKKALEIIKSLYGDFELERVK